MIDATQIITKSQRDESEAIKAREAAIAARAAKYSEITDPKVLEALRKLFAGDPSFAEINELVEQIHAEIPIPEPGE